MGTDNYGRDLFSRIIYGARVSLLISLMALVFSLIIGIGLGATAGYFGGWYESVIMRICDILMCIPGMLLAVCISSLLGIGEVNTAIAIAVSGVAPAIRMIPGHSPPNPQPGVCGGSQGHRLQPAENYLPRDLA